MNNANEINFVEVCGLEHSPLAIAITVGENHVIHCANDAFGRLCQCPPRELVRQPFHKAIHGNSQLSAALDRVYVSGNPETLLNHEHLTTSQGLEYWSFVIWSVNSNTEEPPHLMVQVTNTTEAMALQAQAEAARAHVRDINEALLKSILKQQELAEEAAEAARIRAEDQARIARQAQLVAIADERRQLACEIHDTMAQSFTGILIQVRVVKRIASLEPALAANLVDLVEALAQEGLSEARMSIAALQPDAAQFRDVVAALHATVERSQSRTQVQIQLETADAPESIPPHIGMYLLRIASEALANTIQHASANTIRIELAQVNDRLELRIKDDGCGFDIEDNTNSGFGLTSIKHRAERLGGKLVVTTAPGHGTEIAVSIPIPRSKF